MWWVRVFMNSVLSTCLRDRLELNGVLLGMWLAELAF